MRLAVAINMVLVLAISCSPVALADGPAASQPATSPTTAPAAVTLSPAQVQEVRALIAQLGSASANERKAAQNKLGAYGLGAWSEICQGLANKDIEVREACGALVAALESQIKDKLEAAMTNFSRHSEEALPVLQEVARCKGSRFAMLALVAQGQAYDVMGLRDESARAFKAALEAKVEFTSDVKSSRIPPDADPETFLKTKAQMALLENQLAWGQFKEAAQTQIANSNPNQPSLEALVAMAMYRLGMYKQVIHESQMGFGPVLPVLMRSYQRLGMDAQLIETIESSNWRFTFKPGELQNYLSAGRLYDAGDPQRAWDVYANGMQNGSLNSTMQLYLERVLQDEPRISVPFLIKQLDGPGWMHAAKLLAAMGAAEAQPKILQLAAKTPDPGGAAGYALCQALAMIATDDAWKIIEKYNPNTSSATRSLYPQAKWAKIAKQRAAQWQELKKTPWKPTPLPTTTSAPTTKP